MKVLLALVVLGIVKQSFQVTPPILKVSIYYESLCPYSVDYIKDEVYPAYEKIGTHLSMDFVPYGNANHSKINDKWEFNCQHGEEECWGNKAQACGLAQDSEESKKVEYIYCIMSHKNPASKDAVNLCAPKLDLIGENILTCITERGDELLAQLGEKQDKEMGDNLQGVPSTMFNDNYDPKIDEEASNDFLETACKLLGNAPENCPAEDNVIEED